MKMENRQLARQEPALLASFFSRRAAGGPGGAPILRRRENEKAKPISSYPI
jgi:hypothetical protein